MYTSFYEFSAKPFNVTPDPRFLYLTGSHRESLASMIYGIKERKGFISITGEVGTGKTTLIYSLLTNLDEKIKTVFLFHTDITFEQLLKNILLELGLRVSEEGKTYLLRTLNGYLIESFSRDENLAVIIDEAQNLPKNVLEELRMLSNLETPRSKLLQMVLVGQPELEVKLNSEDLRQLKQRIGIRRQIMPLSLRESQEYIDHRLHIAGSKSSNIFTNEAISLICNYARGIPRTINVLCDNALLIGYSLSKKRIDGDIIHEVIRDMEGSVGDKPLPVEPVLPNLLRSSPPKSGTFFKMTAFFFIFLLCIVLGVVLGREYFQNNSNRPEDSKSPQNTSADVSQITSKGEVKIKRSVTVEKNDSLSSLGWKYYGTMNETLVDLILDSNPQIKNIHLISVGQQIILPEITEESLIIPSTDHTFKIHLGTFSDAQSARKYENEPALMGKEIETTPREMSPVDIWYRITVGRYDDKAACLEVIGLLRKKKLLPVFEGV
jgi:type II secretory pathway predicted ATPase ExeA/phage tail protein X